MVTLEFYKMEGAGNDFVVFDNREYGFSLERIIEFTPAVCDRKFGIGADGILVLEHAEIPGSHYQMIYRNADGSNAGMCGNGGRCIALFAHRNGYPASHSFHVHENIYQAEVKSSEISILFPTQVQPSKIVLQNREFIMANAATEHLVTFVKKHQLDEDEQLVLDGRAIRYHEKMNPPGTNVNFICVEKDDLLHVQTYERGVENLTLACGTGAIASAIAAHSASTKKPEHARMQVQTKGGSLQVEFDFLQSENTYHNLILTGPASIVFQGKIHI